MTTNNQVPEGDDDNKYFDEIDALCPMCGGQLTESRSSGSHHVEDDEPIYEIEIYCPHCEWSDIYYDA
jgi:hypothetical protein